MQLKNKIFAISIIIIIISIIGAYSAYEFQNNESDEIGCCSMVLQLDNQDYLMSFRRDSNNSADIKIENINVNGMNVIKQYKTDGKYFSHVIITENGWVMGFGGIDDGTNSEKCEKIALEMINDNNSISKKSLEEIQKIKQPYKRGHFLIKAPNGNYGIATVTNITTGKLEPGQYVSIPNNYSLFRSGELSQGNKTIKAMNELAQSDKYGVDRRDIITYNYTSNNKAVEVYVSNEDGSKLGKNYTGCVDDVYVNNNVTKTTDIPIAPNYKHIASLSLTQNSTNTILLLVGSLIFVVILSFGAYKLVKKIRSR